MIDLSHILPAERSKNEATIKNLGVYYYLVNQC
jgi:hypothetical protein